MTLPRQGPYSFYNVNQPDRPEMTADQLKAAFDTQGNEIADTYNSLIDALESVLAGNSGADNIGSAAITDIPGLTTRAQIIGLRDVLKSITSGSSGASFVGASPIPSLSGTNVQAMIASLKGYIDTSNTNLINLLTNHEEAPVLDHPDRSVTLAKLQDLPSGGIIGRTAAGVGVAQILPITTFGASLIDDADAAAARATLGAASTDVATTASAGLMSASDKTKLDGVQAGAEVNQNAFSSIAVAGQTTVEAETKTDTLTLIAGIGISLTTNPTTDSVTIQATGSAAPAPHASTHITGGTDTIPDAVPNGNSGLMSGADKQKLNGASAMPSANSIMMRDSNGRSQIQTPVSSSDVANKAYTDTKLAISDYTDVNVLNKIKNVDGLGSGLEADTVPGYGIGAQTVSTLTDMNQYVLPGTYVTAATGLTNLPAGWSSSVRKVIFVVGGGSYAYQIIRDVSSLKTAIRSSQASVYSPWQEIWDTSMLRITNGQLEFNNGGTWTPVSGSGIIVSSANERFIDATERIQTQTSQEMLAAKFALPFTGELILSVDLMPGSTGVNTTVNLVSPVASSTQISSVNRQTGLDYTTPLGTYITGATDSYSRTVLTTVAPGTQVYTTYSYVISVKQGVPYYLFFAGNSSAGAQSRLRNVRLRYDVIRG